MTPPARFRSSDRDARTDRDRLGPLQAQLDRVLAGIARESDGLSRRLEEARTRAAALMGTEDGIYYEREPADEAALVEAEAQMMAASRRLERLRAQSAMVGSWRTEMADSGTGGIRGGTPPAAWPSGLLRRAEFRAAAIRRISRLLGWALMLAIVYATFSGIDHRPSIAGLTPDIERGLAFLAAAAAFGVGYPRQRVLVCAAGLVAVALLEFAQGWAPSRHGTLHDAVVKAAGLGLGLALVMGMERLGQSAKAS